MVAHQILLMELATGASLVKLTRGGGKRLLNKIYYGGRCVVLTTLFQEFLFRLIGKQGFTPAVVKDAYL